MADYQLTATGSLVIRTTDGTYIPDDPANRDWIEYQAWLAAGNVPDPYVAPPPDPPLKDANARLDAGVLAALEIALVIKDSMQAIPDGFTATHFTQLKIQLDALTEAFAEMLKAQADPNAPVKPLKLHKVEVEAGVEAGVEEETAKPKRKRSARKRR